MARSICLEAAPYLLVDDVVRAAAHYRDVLGFQPGPFFGDPPGFVILQRNAARIMLRQRPAELRHLPLSHTAQLAEAVDLYVWISDVDSLAAEWRANGADIVAEPEDEDGRREMLVRDVDGHMLCFGEVSGWPR